MSLLHLYKIRMLTDLKGLNLQPYPEEVRITDCQWGSIRFGKFYTTVLNHLSWQSGVGLEERTRPYSSPTITESTYEEVFWRESTTFGEAERHDRGLTEFWFVTDQSSMFSCLGNGVPTCNDIMVSTMTRYWYHGKSLVPQCKFIWSRLWYRNEWGRRRD